MSPLLLLAILAPCAPAQAVPRDAMIVAATADIFGATMGQGGGLWLLSPDRMSFTKLTGHSADVAWANCVAVDPATGFVYVGTGSYESSGAGQIYRLIVAGTTVANETRITTSAPDTGSIAGITLRGNDVWYVTDGGGVTQGAIGFVPATGGTPTNVYVMQAAQVPDLGQSITTDGREIFVGTSTSTSTTTNLWVLDPESATPALRPFALTPLVTFSNSLGQLSLAADGQIFASDFGGFGHLIDPLTATVTTLNVGKRAPQASAHGGVIQPWLQEYVAVPGYSPTTPREVHRYDIATATWGTALGTAGPPGFPTGVASMHEAPFERHRRGCSGGTAAEPFVGETGLPRLGATITIDLARAAPNLPAFLLLGASNTMFAGQPLPIDLGIAGAPGCLLLTAPQFVFAATTDGNGAAHQTLPIPNLPGLAGGTFYVQWAVPSPGANLLGLLASAGGVVRIR